MFPLLVILYLSQLAEAVSVADFYDFRVKLVDVHGPLGREGEELLL